MIPSQQHDEDDDDDPSSSSSCKIAITFGQHQSQNQNTKYRTRPRFHTLELDLSCTRNKFPIRRDRCGQRSTDYSPTTPTGDGVSTPLLFGSERSASALTSPTTQPELPTLYCEQRAQQQQQEEQLKGSKSEAALMVRK